MVSEGIYVNFKGVSLKQKKIPISNNIFDFFSVFDHFLECFSP